MEALLGATEEDGVRAVFGAGSGDSRARLKRTLRDLQFGGLPTGEGRDRQMRMDRQVSVVRR